MAEGRIVTNDQGQQAWWDGKNLTPIKIQPGTKLEPADIAAGVAGRTEAVQDVINRIPAEKQRQANEFNRLGVLPPSEAGQLPPPQAAGVLPPGANPANPPRFPKAEKVMEMLAGPAATAAAGALTGGMSIPAQMGIGAATEAISEKMGGKELSPTAIGGAALLPPAVRGVGKAIQGVGRGAAKILGKQNLVEAGVEKAEQALGKKAASTAAETARAAAMANVAEVPQTNTAKVVMDVLGKKGRVTGIDEKVFETVEQHVRNAKAAAVQGKPIQYNELFESAINLNKKAAKATGHDKDAYLKMRDAINADLKAIGPEAEEFYKAYRTKASIKDVATAMRAANPTKAVSDILVDPMLKGVFSKAQEDTVKTIANHIGPAGLAKLSGSIASLGILGYHAPVTGGASVVGPAIIGALVGTPKVGPVLARSLIGPDGLPSKAAMPALAQLVRGYMAEQASQGAEGQ